MPSLVALRAVSRIDDDDTSAFFGAHVVKHRDYARSFKRQPWSSCSIRRFSLAVSTRNPKLIDGQ